MILNELISFIFQITRKLAGESKGTVNWCTNVGNKFAQVLNSVFTANEGQGLQKMISGIVKR